MSCGKENVENVLEKQINNTNSLLFAYYSRLGVKFTKKNNSSTYFVSSTHAVNACLRVNILQSSEVTTVTQMKNSG